MVLGDCQLSVGRLHPKQIVFRVSGSWFCRPCSRRCFSFSMWHECASQMPDEGGQPCGINQKLMAEALAMIESTQQVGMALGDKCPQFQQGLFQSLHSWTCNNCMGKSESVSSSCLDPGFHLHVHLPTLRCLFNAFHLCGSVRA